MTVEQQIRYIGDAMSIETDRLRNAAAQCKHLHPYHDFDTLNQCRNSLMGVLAFMPEAVKKTALEDGFPLYDELSMKRLIPLKVLADSQPGPPVAQHSQIADQIRSLLAEEGMSETDIRDWLSGWADELEGKESYTPSIEEI